MKAICRSAVFFISLLPYLPAVFAEGGPNTSVQSAYVLWPDGMAVADSIPPSTGQGTEGTPQWFRFGAGAGRSYSIEIFQLRENGVNSAAQATLGSVFNDTAGTTAVTFNDLSFSDPSGGDFNPPALRRFSIKDIPSNGPVFLKIVSALNFETPATQSFKIRVVDTTLVGSNVKTVGYFVIVDLHNSSDQTVSGSIHFYDEAGTLIGSKLTSLSPRGTSEVSFAPRDATFGGKRGSIEVSHDAPPGSLNGYVYMAKSSKGTGQLGSQMPLQESRSWGRGTY